MIENHSYAFLKCVSKVFFLCIYVVFHKDLEPREGIDFASRCALVARNAGTPKITKVDKINCPPLLYLIILMSFIFTT
jgi:hypothetical protein